MRGRQFLLVRFESRSAWYLVSDSVVLEPEVLVDVGFGVEVADDDLAAVGKGDRARAAVVLVRHRPQYRPPQVVDLLARLFADFAHVQTLQARQPLAVVERQLRKRRMTLARPPGPALGLRDLSGA